MTDETRFPYQATGEERERALAKCYATLRGWDLTMPDFDPLVLDFGLGRFREIGEIEFWVANEEEAGYCGKFLFVDENQTCPYHKHDVKHETFFVVKGKVRMVVDGAERLLDEGDTLVMDAGKRHEFSGIEGPALILEVSMASSRGDNFFADESIGEQGVI